jgi:hypothetical protein
MISEQLGFDSDVDSDPVGSTSLCRVHILIKGLALPSDLDPDPDL